MRPWPGAPPAPGDYGLVPFGEGWSSVGAGLAGGILKGRMGSAMTSMVLLLSVMCLMVGCAGGPGDGPRPSRRGLAGEPGARVGLTAEGVLTKLREGNLRYAEAREMVTPVLPQERAALLHEQHPIAAVIGCADSRVMVEPIFDQRIGALFVNRVAGNLVTAEILASCEYAVAKLNVPVVMVLGHTGCGAVEGSLLGGEARAGFPPYLREMLDEMAKVTGAVRGAEEEEAVRLNVEHQVEQLRRSPLIAQREKEGAVVLLGAVYDMESGVVDFLFDNAGGSGQ